MLWEHEVAGSNPVAPTKDCVITRSDVPGGAAPVLQASLPRQLMAGHLGLVQRFDSREQGAECFFVGEDVDDAVGDELHAHTHE